MTIRVLIVSGNISLRMGGEASLPYYYAKLLEERGAEVYLACHERVRDEVYSDFPDMLPRIHIVKDTQAQIALYRIGEKLGDRIKVAFTEQAIHLITQAGIRKAAQRLAKQGAIDVVLEPAPITPKGVSLMYDLGVPVVIGPLCGGMSFPPAFRHLDSGFSRALLRTGRRVATLGHKILPGKLYADAILVANERTKQALPKSVRGRVIQLFESGVDLKLWTAAAEPGTHEGPVRFAYSGAFRDLKGVQFLVSAFKRVIEANETCELHLIGGGDLDQELRSQVRTAGLEHAVRFYGWVERAEAARIVRDSDVFVMPSLRECGGTAILEALALGKPVIATRWGGPGEYVNASCGILVEPNSPQGFVEGLATAMLQLARSPDLRRELGAGGILRVRQDYLDWDSKADRVLAILNEVVEERRTT